MVSLDEEIQKDRQQHKQSKGKKFNQRHQPRDRRPHNIDKRRTIHKNQRKHDRPHIRRDQRDKNLQRNRDNRFNRNQQKGPRRIQREENGQRRIKRVPRKESKERIEEGNKEKGRTLRVMGLHPDFTNEDLYKLFATEGALEKCLIEQDNFGRSLTTAIVKYHNAASAKNAIANLNQHKVMNSILTVEPYKRR